VQVGADRILDMPFRDWIATMPVGLVTNPAGVNSQFEPTAAVLSRSPGTEVTALFGPEHGFLGHELAERPVASTARVHSLYGQTNKPTPEMLAPIEVLLFDLQDVGARFYTYVSTLFLCMQAAAESQIPLIVMDRPNPIGGDRVEGTGLEPDFKSFVGIHGMPVRHGMTTAELARLFNAEAGLGCDLRVVPLLGWRRDQWFDETGLQWICPSPDLATLTTATVYIGFCLLEGTNLSFGRGTVRPFELVGAPWLKAEELTGRLNSFDLPGVHFRTQSFVPGAGRFRGEICRGFQIHVLDRDTFQPLPAALHVLAETIRFHPRRFKWRARHFDRLAGSDRIRRSLTLGEPVDSIVESWQPGVEQFRRSRQPYLLYQ
jgi:uncharacterized protein YbbC (DUF1343 family)